MLGKSYLIVNVLVVLCFLGVLALEYLEATAYTGNFMTFLGL